MSEWSYSAANIVPLKMLLDKDVLKSAKKGKIIPIHAQFMPTNKCNRNCKFCSCSKRDKNLEMDFEKSKKVIDGLKRLGCKAVTLTGGGEPSLYPKINELINYFVKKKIKVGVVTNGTVFDKVSPYIFNKVTWCRISCSDYYDVDLDDLFDWINCFSKVDLSFSYVVSDKPDYGKIKKIVKFADWHGFTHIRFVSDILNPEKSKVKEVREYLRGELLDFKFIIYQDRRDFTRGDRFCYIGYLKPVISPDFKIYTCCGAQYALDNPSRDVDDRFCIGNALDLKKVYEDNKPFNGAICSKCYYSDYNKLLGGMLQDIKHKEFV